MLEPALGLLQRLMRGGGVRLLRGAPAVAVGGVQGGAVAPVAAAAAAPSAVVGGALLPGVLRFVVDPVGVDADQPCRPEMRLMRCLQEPRWTFRA